MKKMNKFTAATAAFALPAMVFAPAAHAATFGDELRDAFTLPIASAQVGDQDGFKAADVAKQDSANEQPDAVATNTGAENGGGDVESYTPYSTNNGNNGGETGATADNAGGGTGQDGAGDGAGAGSDGGTTGGDTGTGAENQPGTGEIDGTTPPAPQPETQPGTQTQAPETAAPQPETQAPATTENQSPGTVTQQPTATATQEQQAPVVADTTEQAPTVEAAPAPETLPVTGGGVSEMAWAAGAAAALALAAGAVGFRRQEQA